MSTASPDAIKASATGTIFMHKIRLDEKHLYWRETPTGEARVGGFSEICLDMGVTKPNPFYTAEGREIGTAAHKWLNFFARGGVTKAVPDPKIAGEVAAIKKFLTDSGFVYTGGEMPLYDDKLDCACSPDLWGKIAGVAWVIDAKAGGKLKVAQLQTAAQKLALASNGFRAQKRGGLYLRENGDYRLIEHEDKGDENRWRAIVGGYHAKKAYL